MTMPIPSIELSWGVRMCMCPTAIVHKTGSGGVYVLDTNNKEAEGPLRTMTRHKRGLARTNSGRSKGHANDAKLSNGELLQ